MATSHQVLPYLQHLAALKTDFLAVVGAGTPAEDWVVTVGNEAGDLDSLASALAYAHFAAQREPAASARRFVPLVLTARTDLHLRPENALALASAGVTNDSLLTLDDLPAARLATLGARFALVDHNSLLPAFRSNPTDPADAADDARVLSIIDHHVDEGRHLAANPRRIEVVGSCASLVADSFLASADAGALDVPGPIADLLLSAIMIDTRLKLAEEGGKASPIDVAAVGALLPFSSFAASATATNPSASSSPFEAGAAALDALKAHNARLSHAKEDVAHLSARDLLRRDYKEYLTSDVRYGLSTVPLSLSTLLEAPPAPPGNAEEKVARLVADVRAWMAERGLDAAGVLTSYMHVKRKSGKEGKHRRELLLVLGAGARDNAALQGVFGALEKDEVLRLEEWKDSDVYGVQEGGGAVGGERWRIWQQGNDRATRKQVAPSLKTAVEQAVGGAGGATAQL
ncbi:Exopolyphosphatase [Rhodotorula kratochvilovae]